MANASDGTTSSAPADVSATSQQVDSNNTTMPSSAVHVELDLSQNVKADVRNHIAGYIFMCNTATKPDCFMYRVFGLPASRLKVVQKIKPNTKLFLFDFDVKLLYGLYVADASGKLALEPYAFGGRFPAQVRFSIAKDCLPLPEAVFKDVIKENYTGSKFKQELSDEQVNKLVSLFRPIDVPSPPQLSLGFSDALRSLFQKHVEPSHQVTRYANMHNDRRVSDVPQVASASSYYGQNPMPQSTVTPISPVVATSSSMLPSSSRVSHLVAVAARALNAEGQTSSFISPSSNVSDLSHAPLSYNGSNIREVGYGHYDQVGPSSHHALSVSDRVVHAYDPHSYPVSSHYRNESNATLPQTLASGSNGTSVDNLYLNYTSRNHPASINYGYAHNQGVPAVPQIQPSSADNSNLNLNGTDSAILAYDYQNQGHATLPQTLDSGSSRNHSASINYGYAHSQGVPALPLIQPSVNADYYNGINSASLAYDYRNQGYYSSHQTAVGTSIQQSNIVPRVHQPYWPTTPGYMNQDYYRSNYSSGLPVVGADVTAGYAPVAVPRVYLT